MSKKQRTVKTRRSPKRVKRIHYFYVIAAVALLASGITYVLLPIKNSGVLSAHTYLTRAEGTADGGKVEIKGPDRNHETKIHIEAKEGKSIERDDESGASASGDGKRRMREIRDHALIRAEERERRQERRGEIKEKLKDLSVIGEDGEEISLKKNRKEKVLILPEKAVAALVKNGHLQVVASGSAAASSSGQPVVIYTRANGAPVYIVAGSKEEKLFGAFPVNLDKTVTVSAETGEVVNTEESVLTRILDLFSF